MNYYEKNMESLKIYQNFLYTKLSQQKEICKTNVLDDIQSIDTRDGNKAVKITYHSMEYRLNSLYRPVEEAKKWAEQYSFLNAYTIISMYGFGNGEFARELLEKIDKDDIFLIYEPCYEIFEHVLKHYDLEDIIKDKRIVLVVEGVNDDTFHMLLKSKIRITNIGSLVQCIYPNYDNIFTESCVTFFKQIKENMTSARVNINTAIKFGSKSIENIMKNIKYLPKSNTLHELRELMPKDLPAIVVAAGPSVSENIELLKQAKGKSVIFAVDRVLDYLLDQGLEPDFVVTIDPRKDKKYFSKRDDITIPLICYIESNHDILELHKGRKILNIKDLFTFELYKRANKMPSLLSPSGSVAIVAYSACVELGFKRVVLVGQDLAFHGEVSHVGGQTSTVSKSGNVWVEDLDGNQIESRYDWKEFIIQYQDLIKGNKDVEVIDAKTKGAKIDGTIVMPLQEVMRRYCTHEFDPNCISNMNALFQQEDMKLVKEFLEHNYIILKNIKDKSRKAIKLCETLQNEAKRDVITKKSEDANHKIYSINEYIQKQPIYSIMDHYITAKTSIELSSMLHFTEDAKENKLFTYKKSKVIYQAVVEAVDFIREYMDDTISKL